MLCYKYIIYKLQHLHNYLEYLQQVEYNYVLYYIWSASNFQMTIFTKIVGGWQVLQKFFFENCGKFVAKSSWCEHMCTGI